MKFSRSISQYFKRFSSPERVLQHSIDPSCKMIIVIPCHNEPDLIRTLESLVACESIKYSVEVIIVLNEEAGSRKSKAGSQNRQTAIHFENWTQKSQIPKIKFHLIEALDMPKKTAGVGLARKIGMDEALRRFSSVDVDGTIVCLDADCLVSKNYLRAIDQQFIESDAGIGEMHFEHPFENESNLDLRTGILNYELFLRYYVEGLRQSKFPNAIHTIGSCMLVRASVYAKHGGMNKRKAGEDFYFLHKIVPHEKFITVTEGTVFPSCRTSDRVPFGTGKAQNDWLNQENKTYLTYDTRVFDDLKVINTSLDSLFELDCKKWLSELSDSVQLFFDEHQYAKKVELIKSNCKTIIQFRKQFYIWFDGFMCMKFVHFLRDRFYSDIPISKASSMLIGEEEVDLELLLGVYRKKDLRGETLG